MAFSHEISHSLFYSLSVSVNKKEKFYNSCPSFPHSTSVKRIGIDSSQIGYWNNLFVFKNRLSETYVIKHFLCVTRLEMFYDVGLVRSIGENRKIVTISDESWIACWHFVTAPLLATRGSIDNSWGWGLGKSTYPLSANANVLSVTPRLLITR
jgi:hypothetical protein